MSIAPNPLYPAQGRNSFERTVGANGTNTVGMLRHEEGLASDTDIPSDFVRGAYYDTAAMPGTINFINRESVFKHAAETMHERAHLGSAAWEDSPQVLQDFVQGAGVGQNPPSFERVMNPNTIQARRASTVVID